jgi:hypothetical protein
MKSLLAQSVNALINKDMASAKTLYKEYITQKSRAVLEKVEEEKLQKDMVEGHCDCCGEPATTTRAILNSKKWECGKCDCKKFDKE